jgi:hypothetical protein
MGVGLRLYELRRMYLPELFGKELEGPGWRVFGIAERR